MEDTSHVKDIYVHEKHIEHWDALGHFSYVIVEGSTSGHFNHIIIKRSVLGHIGRAVVIESSLSHIDCTIIVESAFGPCQSCYHHNEHLGS